jgi:hypothetical protein
LSHIYPDLSRPSAKVVGKLVRVGFVAVEGVDGFGFS